MRVLSLLMAKKRTMRNNVCHCCGGTGRENDHFAIGKAMKASRGEIKAAAIAYVMKISPQFISDLEKGRRCWTVALIDRYNTAVKELSK